MRPTAPLIVAACLRDGRGGSPTAVLPETGMSDAGRRRVPADAGASHAVFVHVPRATDGNGRTALRFFTTEGELPACGHGTVAALARSSGADAFQATLESARTFDATAHRLAGTDVWRVSFDPGPVAIRETTDREHQPILDALGAPIATPGIHEASVGRPRLLVPVASRAELASLTPDFDRLREACDRRGLLGCYVYSPPAPDGRLAARMFAPSIGVPEDIANANSTACLAALLATRGIPEIAVDMGDSLGAPATVTAGGTPTRVRVGGTARIPA